MSVGPTGGNTLACVSRLPTVLLTRALVCVVCLPAPDSSSIYREFEAGAVTVIKKEKKEEKKKKEGP